MTLRRATASGASLAVRVRALAKGANGHLNMGRGSSARAPKCKKRDIHRIIGLNKVELRFYDGEISGLEPCTYES